MDENVMDDFTDAGEEELRGISCWRSQVRFFLSHDAGPIAQFVKYGMAGGVATVVHITLFFLVGWRLFPSLTSDDWMVRLLGVSPGVVEESRRALNAAISTSIAFVVSNAVAYILNVWFVFQKGRHRWIVEVSMFYAVSGISMLVGTMLQSILIYRYSVMTTLAFGTNLISALLINYTMRRFVIFKG